MTNKEFEKRIKEIGQEMCDAVEEGSGRSAIYLANGGEDGGTMALFAGSIGNLGMLLVNAMSENPQVYAIVSAALQTVKHVK